MSEEGNEENFIEFDEDELKVFIERVETVAVDKDRLTDKIGEIYTEAKDAGFNTKVMRRVVSDRKKERKSVDGERAIYDAYMKALGEFGDTPLGQSAGARVAPRAAKKVKEEAAAKPARRAPAVQPVAGGTPRAARPSAEEKQDTKELGRRARLAGKMRESNVCEPGSVDAQLWDAGWAIGDQEISDQAALADAGNHRAGRQPESATVQ